MNGVDTREYKYLDELIELLKPFNIGTVYADNNFAYESRITEKNTYQWKKEYTDSHGCYRHFYKYILF